MAKILLVDSDPLDGIIAEDWLRGAGYIVVTRRSATGVPQTAIEEHVDALVVHHRPPEIDGFGLLDQLGDSARTGTLPVLLCAEPTAAKEGVAALRAGADDFMACPYDVEELVLRVARLMSSRAPGQSLLAGELEDQPLWELLQFFAETRKSGRLSLLVRRKPAEMRLRSGVVAEASYDRLRGIEAALALMDLEQGAFRFVPGPEPPRADDIALEVPRLLMESAWLTDELVAREHLLPGLGETIRYVGSPREEAPEGFHTLPVQDVRSVVKKADTLSLYDLLNAQAASSRQVKLALAWLIEAGSVERVSERTPHEIPTTGEIRISAILDAIVGDLLQSKKIGNEPTNQRILLLAEPDAWDGLVAIFSGLPSGGDDDPWEQLRKPMSRGRGGSTSLHHANGNLSIVVRRLLPDNRNQIRAVEQLCMGVGLWVGASREASEAHGVIERLSRRKDRPVGVLVPMSERSASQRAEELSSGQEGWRVCPQPPRSLVAILQLFR